MIISAVVLGAIWVVALVGYHLARNARMTADKVKAYAESTDLSKLSGAARAKAIKDLEAMLNSLSTEERQKARFERPARAWFDQMTEDEKGQFIEATMPTGFKQMLTAFEDLPSDKRRRTVDDALRRLKEQEVQYAADQADGNNPPIDNGPVLSPELQAKVRTIGLQAFYSQASAQTKAELAPLLEELQRSMQSGRAFRGR